MTRSTTTALLRRGCVIIGTHHTRNNNTRPVVAGSSIEKLKFSHPHLCWFSLSSFSHTPAAAAAAPTAAAPYILLHHHRDPSLIPHRKPGSFTYLAYHISSAIDAIVTLISSQEARDQFLALTTVAATKHNNMNSSSDDANTTTSSSSSSSEEEGGILMGAIINSRILNQSDVGFLKQLTLYNELLHPKLQNSSKFNIHEFMAGCGWALSKFHRTKDGLVEKLSTYVADSVVKKSKGVVELEDDNGGDDDNHNSQKKNDEESLMGNKDGEDIPLSSSRAEEYNFLEVAANDPDSVEGTFVAMTTPNAMQLDGFVRLLAGQIVSSCDARTEDQIQIDKLKEYYNTGGGWKLIDDETKVMNVALLSAMVEEIYPPLIKSSSAEQVIFLQKTKSNDDPNAPLEDESLAPPPEVDESKAQLITHLEVLYEVQQSYVNDEGKTRTKTSVFVGKFEGCLFGDPNGDELRWKLDSYRPAVEFFNTA